MDFLAKTLVPEQLHNVLNKKQSFSSSCQDLTAYTVWLNWVSRGKKKLQTIKSISFLMNNINFKNNFVPQK